MEEIEEGGEVCAGEEDGGVEVRVAGGVRCDESLGGQRLGREQMA